MNRAELKRTVALGEDSRRQFKQDIRNAASLASDMVAYSNSAGGGIFIGVSDDGALLGLSPLAGGAGAVMVASAQMSVGSVE